MEEILASIKRVIAEDVPPPAPRSRAARKVEPGAEDVLELSQSAEEPLLSDQAAQSSREALAALSEVSQKNPATEAGNGALDAIVREMLRPMLKQWLDERLPEMVEDMVRQEIARITGRTL